MRDKSNEYAPFLWPGAYERACAGGPRQRHVTPSSSCPHARGAGSALRRHCMSNEASSAEQATSRPAALVNCVARAATVLTPSQLAFCGSQCRR